MKLYTDSGNFQTIKVLSAANFAGFALQKEHVDHGAKLVPYLKGSCLPVLELFPDNFIFSANATVSYLFAKGAKSVSEEDDHWLEWESTHLAPVSIPYLVNTLGHGRSEKDHLQLFTPLLSELEEKLKIHGYLSGKGLSAADVVVFGALYPLLQDKAFQEVMEMYPVIRSWASTIEAHQAVQTAISEVTAGKGAAAFKESLLTQPIRHAAAVRGSQQPLEGKSHHVQAGTPKSSLSEKPEEPMEKVTAEEAESAFIAWNTDRKNFPTPTPRHHPILPKADRRNVLITSALPYVNNVPHLGNIIGCVLSADVFSRFCRLRDYNVLYICGTDEYGTATETKALEEGLTPREICDKYNKLHTEIYQWFNIDFDYFGRTTTQQQTEISQDIFWHLHKRGFIMKDSVEQLYCASCDKFLADRFVEGVCPLCGFDDARGDQCDSCGRLINATELKQPRCKLCQKAPSLRISQHLFLDLPQLEPELKVYLDKVFASGTWTSNARTITNSWIRDGLKPRCISRDLKWGTPVPLKGFEDKLLSEDPTAFSQKHKTKNFECRVFYVWFDAPIGYISITAKYTDQWKQWWKNPEQVEMYNFLGKDNVPFHSVIFPACLLGANDGYTIVSNMFATEYLNYEDSKFSKSRGSGVFGDQAKDTGIPADVYRFYLLYVRPESQDTSFSWDDLLLKNNSELLNNLGNFINRALMFLANNFDGIIQEMPLEDDDKQLLALITRELNSYIDNMERGRLRDSIRNILTISRLGNQFMQASKPWVSVKGTPQERQRAGAVVSVSINISCLLSVLLQPYMPSISQTVQQQLNAPPHINIITKSFVCLLPPGHKIGKPSPLFQKIETSTIANLKTRFAGQPISRKPINKTKVKTGETVNAKGDIVNGKPLDAADEAEVARISDEVTKQGNVVRDLKSAKAEKSAIDTEVAKLLELKKQLVLAQGLDSAAAAPSGGKKKGKKK